MPTYADRAPGVYFEEVPGARSIEPVGTSTAAFVGQAPDAGAHLNEVIAINNRTQFASEFASKPDSRPTLLSYGVDGFFQNGGTRCFIVNMPDGEAIAGTDRPRTGLKLLEEIDEISIVAAPGRTDPASHDALLTHCEQLGDRFCILDPPRDVKNTELLKTVELAAVSTKGKDKDIGASGSGVDTVAKSAGGLRPRISPGGYGAFYFPWVYVLDALNPKGDLIPVPPSGHMAGVYAFVDGKVGVHKADANVPLRGALNLTYRVTSTEQATLNGNGINCIRSFANEGIVVWGARTLDDPSSEFRYVPVRRTTIFIEQSIVRGTRFAVFEPNNLQLWKTLKSAVTAFLMNVYRDGALMGATPEEAFFVKCDAETNPKPSIDLGQVVVVIGIALVKPAEFIVFKIGQQVAGAKIEAL
jgi:phage tail sheath protein FI